MAARWMLFVDVVCSQIRDPGFGIRVDYLEHRTQSRSGFGRFFLQLAPQILFALLLETPKRPKRSQERNRQLMIITVARLSWRSNSVVLFLLVTEERRKD